MTLVKICKPDLVLPPENHRTKIATVTRLRPELSDQRTPMAWKGQRNWGIKKLSKISAIVDCSALPSGSILFPYLLVQPTA
jgi:hypothetical protein